MLDFEFDYKEHIFVGHVFLVSIEVHVYTTVLTTRYKIICLNNVINEDQYMSLYLDGDSIPVVIHKYTNADKTHLYQCRNIFKTSLYYCFL